MKILYTFFIITLFSIAATAQRTTLFNLTFEDTAVINQVFYTDSILDSLGVWQIGQPNKPFFDSAYSLPTAIVTRLDSSLQPNTKASFIITVPYRFHYWGGALLTFENKYVLDSAHGRAYVEFSIDSGMHWHSIFLRSYQTQGGYSVENGQEYFCIISCQQVQVDSQYIMPPTWWHNVPQDTTDQGLAYFTGTDTTWTQDTIVIPAGCIFKTEPLNPLMLKFTVVTDSNSVPTAGWMIDNMKFIANPYYCYNGINEINSSHLRVYPDPATDAFHLSISNEPYSDYELLLYDLSGRAVMRRSFSGQEVMIQRGDISPGAYFIQVTDTRTQNTFQKRMVFE